MTAPSPLELRRRSAAERRALELLRGGPAALVSAAANPGGAGRLFRSVGEERRTRLRQCALVAMRHGFAIQPPRASYLHLDELRLLHLIADAQAGDGAAGTPEPLKSAVEEAAAVMTMIGIGLNEPLE